MPDVDEPVPETAEESGSKRKPAARRHGEPAEIVRGQQVGRFRRVVFNRYKRTDRHVNDIEAVIRIGEGTANSGDLKGL